jgi:hypothetical protein
MLGSAMLKITCPTAVVCHDAGATNLILGWLQAGICSDVRAFMQGPAVNLWSSTFPNQHQCNSLEDALSGAQILISGTGWASSLEHQARKLAHDRGIRSVAVLDHWVNYPERFEREGEVQLPSEIWVADTYALDVAQKILPDIPVYQLENLYLKTQVTHINPAPCTDTILVVLEPVRNTWGHDREGEFQALDYFFDSLDSLWPNVKQVLLRPHPSESSSKYKSWLGRYSIARMDTSGDVATAISRADVVVGVESFALVIALSAGRPVYSTLPPWAPALRLPHTGIQQIRYLNRL